MTKYVVRGGNVGLIKDGSVLGEANNCIRQVVLRQYEGQPLIKDTRSRITFSLGTLSEKIVCEDLVTEGRIIKPDFKTIDTITDLTEMQGSIDLIEKVTPGFWPNLPEGDTLVYELKSVSSTRVAEKVFVDLCPKMVNVMQCVNYMISMQVQVGILRYTSMIYMEKINAGDFQQFMITIQDDGEICYQPLIKKKSYPIKTGYNVSQIMKYRTEAAYALETKEVYPIKPVFYEGGFYKPCMSCYCKKMCETFDETNDSDLFFQQVKEYLDKTGRREK